MHTRIGSVKGLMHAGSRTLMAEGPEVTGPIPVRCAQERVGMFDGTAGRRVEVAGLLHYGNDDRLALVEASAIVILPDGGIQPIWGLAREDIDTEGLPPDEHMARAWGKIPTI